MQNWAPEWTQEVTGAKSHCQWEVPGPQNGWGCLTWHCSAQLELLKNRSLFKTVQTSQWRQPCSQQGWSHVLLGGQLGSGGLRFCSWHALSSQKLQEDSLLQRLAEELCSLGTGTASSGCWSKWGLQKLLPPLPPLLHSSSCHFWHWNICLCPS